MDRHSVHTGEAVGQILNVLSEMKVELVVDALSERHRPDSEVLRKCHSLGILIAGKLRERVTTV